MLKLVSWRFIVLWRCFLSDPLMAQVTGLESTSHSRSRHLGNVDGVCSGHPRLRDSQCSARHRLGALKYLLNQCDGQCEWSACRSGITKGMGLWASWWGLYSQGGKTQGGVSPWLRYRTVQKWRQWADRKGAFICCFLPWADCNISSRLKLLPLGFPTMTDCKRELIAK